MLQTFTVEQPTLELLKRLQRLPALENTRLVGGTALALILGHRHSIDLDLFGTINETTTEIIEQLKENNITAQIIDSGRNFHVLNIDNVKIDLVNYKKEWLLPYSDIDNYRLAALEDIAAMKLEAITNRGARKDFIDTYFLLSKFTFGQMLKFYERKYPEGSAFLVTKSATYFADAEVEPMPKMFVNVTWDEIKTRILEELNKYQSQ